MPLYEYQCQSCGEITTALILKPGEEKVVNCVACQGNDMVRMVSRFAVHQTEAQRLDTFDTRTPQDDSFYKDPRNVGLWAQKRTKELGMEVAPEVNEAIEKARSGKILDD